MAEHQIFMPLIASSRPAVVPMGWAIYGVPHEVVHQQMALGIQAQTWMASECCMTHPTFYPSISQLRYYSGNAYYARLVEKYPGRTWLLWNEPDVPSQANITPQQAIPITREWSAMIREHGGKAAGFGVTVVAPDHWLMETGGWRRWLDDYLHYGGDLPDVWHVHVYSGNDVDAWRRYYDAWQVWNEANGNLPTILSEVGQGPKVWEYLNRMVDSRVERMLWFTNFTDVPMTGIP